MADIRAYQIFDFILELRLRTGAQRIAFIYIHANHRDCLPSFGQFDSRAAHFPHSIRPLTCRLFTRVCRRCVAC